MAKKTNDVTGWVGWVFFAAFMMILQGLFNAVAGLGALFNDEWLLVGEENLLLLDYTAWGWWHLILGVLVAWAGIALVSGKVWARVVGVLVAVVSAVGALATVNVYPVWSVVLIVVDILIIYALTVHGDELAE